MRWRVIIAALVLTSASARADRVALQGEALKQTLVDKTVHLDTPFGVAIPITFYKNGLMSGKAGMLEYFLGAGVDRGRWWVADGKLCQKWFKWLDAQPSCMQVQRDGQRIFWQRDDGVSGTATIAISLPPGAEGPPQGLGGPAEPAEYIIPGALTATEAQGLAPEAHVKKMSHHRIANIPPAKPLLMTSSERHHPPPEPARNLDLNLGAGHFALLLDQLAHSRPDQWCDDLAPSARHDAADVPGLIYVSRELYGGPQMGWLATACFPAEPALKEIAKLRVQVSRGADAPAIVPTKMTERSR
jgi:hypothetical protein